MILYILITYLVISFLHFIREIKRAHKLDDDDEIF